MLLPIFHLSVILLNGFTLWYDQQYGMLPFNEQLSQKAKDLPFKARVLFLTIWCLVLQTLYFTLALLNDVIGTNAPAPKKRPIIRFIKDAVYSLAFPVAVIVGATFWAVYAYDKGLILPDHVRKVFPDWMNHTMHTAIIPIIIIEMFLSSITYPPRLVGIALGMLFICSYVGLLAKVYFNSGSLVYPFLDAMNIPTKIAFIVATSLIGMAIYFIGEALNNNLANSLSKDTSSKKTATKSNVKKQKKKV